MEYALAQASVEGHDESSYIYKVIDTAESDIATNKLKKGYLALKYIKELVLPFNFNEFFKLFNATIHTANQLEGKACWVLLGPTGAGKKKYYVLYIIYYM